MKKIPLAVLLIAALGACDKKETTEDCIAWIYNNAQVSGSTTFSSFDESGKPQSREFNMVLELKDNEGQWLAINTETAISLSQNWTMDENMKYYTKDDVIEEHEMDACETKAKIKSFLNKVSELKKSGQ